MQVTKISKQKKRNDRYNVHVDDEFAFSSSANDLLKIKIAKGDHVYPRDLINYRKLAAKSLLKDHAISYQASRPHSQFETKTYLVRKIIKNPEIRLIPRKDQSTVIAEILKELETKGYVSDEKFAKWLINQRIESRTPKSKRAISSELRQKGVPYETIISSLKDYPEDLDIKSAFKIAKKKVRTLTRFTEKQQREKLTSHLKTKGYNWATIKHVVDTISSQI